MIQNIRLKPSPSLSLLAIFLTLKATSLFFKGDPPWCRGPSLNEAGLQLQDVTLLYAIRRRASRPRWPEAALWTQEGHWLGEKEEWGGIHPPQYYPVKIQACLIKQDGGCFFQGTELNTREEDEVQSFCPWTEVSGKNRRKSSFIHFNRTVWFYFYHELYRRRHSANIF